MDLDRVSHQRGRATESRSSCSTTRKRSCCRIRHGEERPGHRELRPGTARLLSHYGANCWPGLGFGWLTRNVVQASGNTVLVVITQVQSHYCDFHHAETAWHRCGRGCGSCTHFRLRHGTRSQSTKIATGKLQSIDNLIDTTTGTVKLRAIFDNKDGAVVSEPVREHQAAGEYGQWGHAGSDRCRPTTTERCPSSHVIGNKGGKRAQHHDGRCERRNDGGGKASIPARSWPPAASTSCRQAARRRVSRPLL